MCTRPREGRVTVRLSQIPLDTRVRVADRIIRVEGLVGVPALEMMLAAREPKQDPAVEVARAVADRVLGVDSPATAR